MDKYSLVLRLLRSLDETLKSMDKTTQIEVMGSTAMRYNLGENYYRKPTDLDLLVYHPPCDPPKQVNTKMLWNALKAVAAKHNLNLRSSGITRLHSASGQKYTDGIFDANRYMLTSEAGELLLKIDVMDLSSSPPAEPAAACIPDTSIRIASPVSILMSKIARYAVQGEKTVRDIFDIDAVLHHLSDSYIADHKELMRLLFIANVAIQGTSVDRLKLNRFEELIGVPTAHTDKFSTLAGRSFNDAQMSARRLLEMLELIKDNAWNFTPAEKEYLIPVGPQVITRDTPYRDITPLELQYQNLFEHHPTLKEWLKSHPIIAAQTEKIHEEGRFI